ncbi:hypothetical protein KCU93_g5890, partial [Aureobasidium melanogenum]
METSDKKDRSSPYMAIPRQSTEVQRDWDYDSYQYVSPFPRDDTEIDGKSESTITSLQRPMEQQKPKLGVSRVRRIPRDEIPTPKQSPILGKDQFKALGDLMKATYAEPKDWESRRSSVPMNKLPSRQKATVEDEQPQSRQFSRPIKNRIPSSSKLPPRYKTTGEYEQSPRFPRPIENHPHEIIPPLSGLPFPSRRSLKTTQEWLEAIHIRQEMLQVLVQQLHEKVRFKLSKLAVAMNQAFAENSHRLVTLHEHQSHNIDSGMQKLEKVIESFASLSMAGVRDASDMMRTVEDHLQAIRSQLVVIEEALDFDATSPIDTTAHDAPRTRAVRSRVNDIEARVTSAQSNDEMRKMRLAFQDLASRDQVTYLQGVVEDLHNTLTVRDARTSAIYQYVEQQMRLDKDHRRSKSD